MHDALSGIIAWNHVVRTEAVTYLRLRQHSIVRTSRVYRPSRRSASSRLALVLRGAIGSAEEIAGVTCFDQQAERLNWVVAYPEAHNQGVMGGWDTYACCRQPGVDDVGFIAALIDELARSDGIDPERVCVAGFSRGGMMAYRLGCELADRLVAIAAVAGNMASERVASRSAGVPAGRSRCSSSTGWLTAMSRSRAAPARTIPSRSPTRR